MVETPNFRKSGYFSATEPMVDRRIKRVRSVLDEQHRDPPSIHDLAEMVGLSTSRLAHLFRDEVGKSIRSYIVECRLQTAARLLEATHERISQIAYSVGFADISNFNHAFKKRFGMSPGEYRHRNGDEPKAE